MLFMGASRRMKKGPGRHREESGKDKSKVRGFAKREDWRRREAVLDQPALEELCNFKNGAKAAQCF